MINSQALHNEILFVNLFFSSLLSNLSALSTQPTTHLYSTLTHLHSFELDASLTNILPPLLSLPRRSPIYSSDLSGEVPFLGSLPNESVNMCLSQAPCPQELRLRQISAML